MLVMVNHLIFSFSGLPSSPPSGSSTGINPSGSPEDPIMANLLNKHQRMNSRTITIITLSAVVFFIACVGAFFIIYKCKKDRRPLTAIGPAFTSSIAKRSSKITNHTTCYCSRDHFGRYVLAEIFPVKVA